MELIKKIILQSTTTGTTTGCTGTCRVIIPDITAIYHMKILLTQDSHDWGFFDIYEYFPYSVNIDFPYPYSLDITNFNSIVSPISMGIGETLLMDDNFI